VFLPLKSLSWAAVFATVMLVAAFGGSPQAAGSSSDAFGAIRVAIDGVATGSKYIYHGCVVYSGSGVGTTGDPFANADITNATPDPVATSVLEANSLLFDTDDDASLEIVNLASSSTTLYTVAQPSPAPGHNPPISVGVYGGGSGAQVPWSTSPQFHFEGTHTNHCPHDCHWTTLNTETCYVYQGDAGPNSGGGGFNGGVFSTYNGLIDSLGASYANQWLNPNPGGPQGPGNKGDNWSVGGFPGLGFTDYDDEFGSTASSINHPIQIILPPSMVLNGPPCANLSPCLPGAGDGACTGTTSTCFLYGDLLRLKSSVSCTPSGGDHPLYLLCNQLKTYGGYVADTGDDQQMRFGLNTSGGEPNLKPSGVESAMWAWIATLPSSKWDLIDRGALVP
jgi:hypothetical protein